MTEPTEAPRDETEPEDLELPQDDAPVVGKPGWPDHEVPPPDPPQL